MAQPNSYFWNVQSRDRDIKLITGKFFPAGTGAPTLDTGGGSGHGFTVVRTSAGLFTVTLEHTWSKLISSSLVLQLAAGDDKALQLGSVNLTAGTIEIRVWDTSGAAVADISANANNAIHFAFVLKRTSVAF